MSQEKGKPSVDNSVDEANIFHDYITHFSRRADLNDDQRAILQNELKINELAQKAVIHDFLPSENQFLSLHQKALRLEEKYEQIKAELEPKTIKTNYIFFEVESDSNRLAKNLLDGLTAEYQKQIRPIIQEIKSKDAREEELHKKAQEEAEKNEKIKAEQNKAREAKEVEERRKEMALMPEKFRLEAEKHHQEQIRELRSLETEHKEEIPKLYSNQKKLKVLSSQIQKLIDVPGADAAVIAELKAKQIEIQNMIELIGKKENELRIDFYGLRPESNLDTRKRLDLLKNFNNDTSTAIDNTEKFMNDQKIKLSGTIDGKIEEIGHQRDQEQSKVEGLEEKLKQLEAEHKNLKSVLNTNIHFIQEHVKTLKDTVYAQVKNDTAKWYNKIPLIKNFFKDEHLRRQVFDPRREAINGLLKEVEAARDKHPPGVVDISKFSDSLDKNVKDKLVSLGAEVKSFHKHYVAQAKNKNEYGHVSDELAKAKRHVVELDQQKKELTEMKNKAGSVLKTENISQTHKMCDG